MTFLSAAILLFLVLDPLGNIPLFLSALTKVPKRRRPKIVLRESLIAYAVLVFFFFFGRFFLNALRLDETALAIAGGVILFLIAIRMIFPPAKGSSAAEFETEPFIVPLAIPLIAGPSAIATVMLFMTHDPASWTKWFLAMSGAWVASTLILIFSAYFHRIFHERGLIALERLMGMILATISIQMLLNGIRTFLGTCASSIDS